MAADATQYGVEFATWGGNQEAIRAVRTAVFVEEQQIPLEGEFDELDPLSTHVVVLHENRDAVGTGRLEPSGRLGRVAVARTHRRRGIGRLIVAALLEKAAERGLERVVLHSQFHAVPLYAQFGFEERGTPFEEAGIPHIKMELVLSVRKLNAAGQSKKHATNSFDQGGSSRGGNRGGEPS